METKTILFTILGIFLAFIIIFVIAGGKNNEDSSINQVSALINNEAMFDFGKISMAKGNVSHRYKITNSGTEPLTIKKIYTSCMCTTATLLNDSKKLGPFGMPGHGLIPSINEELSPGMMAEVEVVFDPAAHGPAGIGKVERTVYIENNSGKPLTLNFTATVTP
ncbi:DUF1573 domain-containing protein [Candidatus Parcubacteria bacterium]|nr:MAG: DUF1573 domain-containing protein [Candidatus Parcubacteria bacterium]